MAVTPELEVEMKRERIIQLRAQHPDGNHPELRAIDEGATFTDLVESSGTGEQITPVAGDTLTAPRKRSKLGESTNDIVESPLPE